MCVKIFLLLLSLVVINSNELNSIMHLEFNEDDRLSSHWLLYSHDKCAFNNRFPKLSEELVSEHRKIASISGDLENLLLGSKVVEFASSSTNQSCSAILLERGVHKEKIHNPLPESTFHMTIDSEITGLETVTGFTGTGVGSENKKSMTLRDWLARSNKAEIGWVSYVRNVDLSVYFIDDDNNRIFSGELQYGERNTVWLKSYLGHRFEVSSKNGTVYWSNVRKPGEEGIHNADGVKYNAYYVLGDSGSGLRALNVEQKVQGTMISEWHRSRSITRTFTEFGFSNWKLPIDLYTSMDTYYYNNKKHFALEEWDTKGVFVNWWQVDVFMLGMPWGLKKYWQGRLKSLVEKWIGGHIPLELSDIYGMRRYEVMLYGCVACMCGICV